MSYAEVKRQWAEEYNRQDGTLNIDHVDANGVPVRGDGIDCPKCRNKGYEYVFQADANGNPAILCKVCGCMTKRMAVSRLRRSGLERMVRRYTFDRFEVRETFQNRMKARAREYATEGAKQGAWMYVGGQSGAGKTHICTAAAAELMKGGMDVLYMLWPHESQRLKALVTDAEAYGYEIGRYKNVDLLYIDDFLKPMRNREGTEAMPTNADVRLAYELLNYRYAEEKPTILSSEWFSGELGALDEALAGRISEACGRWKLDIKRDAKRNFRLRDSSV